MAAPDTSLPGPYSVAIEEYLEGANGAITDFDLYLPSESGPHPALVLGHGFSQYKAYQHDNAVHLASWGFVVLVPTFSSFADHEANAKEMLRLIDWLIGDSNPHRAEVDAARLGLAGHSAGGLSAVIAAGMDAGTSRRISAVVGLDAVDVVKNGESDGAPFAAEITAPTFFLSGIPYACNGDGNAQGLFDAVPDATERMFLRVTQAVHCDFNDQDLDHACTPGMEPARPLQILRLLVTRGWAAAYDAATAGVCSVEGQDIDRTEEIALIRRYLAAWFLARLQDEVWAETYLYAGSGLEADLEAGVVADLQY